MSYAIDSSVLPLHEYIVKKYIDIIIIDIAIPCDETDNIMYEYL